LQERERKSCERGRKRVVREGEKELREREKESCERGRERVAREMRREMRERGTRERDERERET